MFEVNGRDAIRHKEDSFSKRIGLCYMVTRLIIRERGYR